MAVSARITKSWDEAGPCSSPGLGPSGAPDLTGRPVGGYRLVRQVGAGGMGSVYEAVHQGMGRRAAIKVLAPELARDPEIIERFFNEARAVNIVQHPDIVSISEMGQLPDGTAYLVMEYLQGESLSERLHRLERYPVPEALRLSRQIAAALQAAHDKGIVHRDLKPDNVMIVPDPEILGGERAKLLDFGIAKLAEEHESARPQKVRTRAGMLLGTPVYMSPEQCRGASQVDAKADVYSLGVMLYQMLAGRPPFVAEGDGELVAMHIYEEPTPLSELVPQLPKEVSDLVQRMLDKDRGNRPTMAEVVAELSGIIARRPSAAVPVMKPPPLPPQEAPAAPAPQADATLDHAAGQPQKARRRPLPRTALLGAAGALGLLLWLYGTALQRPRGTSVHAVPAPRPPAQPAHLQPRPVAPGPAVPTMATVRWSVVTEPAGADIVLAADGMVLSQTPYLSVRPAGSGIMQVVLRLAGFADKRLDLDLAANVMVRESLSRLPQPPEPPPSKRHRARPAQRPAPVPAVEARPAPGYQIRDFEKVSLPVPDAAHP